MRAILIAAVAAGLLTGSGSSPGLAEDKPIGVLLAAGDIVTTKPSGACVADKFRSGKATADLLQAEIDRVATDFPGVEVQVIALGDLAYEKGESMHCFDQTWGKFKARMLPVPGNHDYETKNGKAYFTYFKSRLQQLNADKKLGTYAIDFPSTGDHKWRLIGLNSNTETGPTTGQVAWLKNELQNLQGKRCVLAFSHAFFYSSGLHGHDDGHGQPQNKVADLSKPLLPGEKLGPMFAALYANRASVFVAGHDHHFEQLGRANGSASPADLGQAAIVPDGVRSFVVGTGGKGLYSYDYTYKWAFTEAYDVKRYGILRIDLYPKSYRWHFIPVIINGQADSMTILKRVDGNPIDRDDCNLAE